MNFGLAMTSSIEVKSKSTIINSMSSELGLYFKDRNYGNDIKSYVIGILCVSPQFEDFYKEKKPKYIKGKKVINPDGIPVTLEDSFEYSIKLDFETFKNATEIESERIVAHNILESLSILNTMKKRIKDFDWDQFRKDLENYFKENNLI